MEPPTLLVMWLLKWAESRRWLNWLTELSERVTAVLMRLWPRADWRTVPEDVLLTPELLLWLSVMLVKLQKWERLSILPQGLLILPLYQ